MKKLFKSVFNILFFCGCICLSLTPGILAPNIDWSSLIKGDLSRYVGVCGALTAQFLFVIFVQRIFNKLKLK